MSSIERINRTSDKMEDALNKLMSGTMGADEVSAAGKVGFVIVKGEEVILNHKITRTAPAE